MANLETGFRDRLDSLRADRMCPGKFSGRPVVRGTRILPDAIVNS